ncbi:BLI-3 blue-light-inducible Bli-3 protein [Exophiala xenobiotica]|uniref:BLI-3 blue-light-inducible Bli-3 protein n=1 Tax=Lithohypha guttulata TaxID=1690604 RepID=A0ABR0K2T5_9EURO|nr:BLI-3 blue-light-inducible Bli-3 protein [Lithohypha guttulata]KAK5312970.1 BLI-3 blue-light-inducible Bli-3 protein [Exophiala xenobiotica]
MSYSNADTGDKAADPYKEKNQDEPGLEQKVQDLVSFIKKSKFGMMTTYSAHQGTLASRCMAIAATEHGGIDLIFHTNTESGKTDDLKEHPEINFACSTNSGDWASVSGTAEIDADRETVKKYYSQELKTWLGDLGDGTHDGSENDPRIAVIRIKAKTATYAISISNPVSRGIEMVQGAITGNAAQVNKLREISESEISQWRSSH